jgi:hypothetical protein
VRSTVVALDGEGAAVVAAGTRGSDRSWVPAIVASVDVVDSVDGVDDDVAVVDV